MIVDCLEMVVLRQSRARTGAKFYVYEQGTVPLPHSLARDMPTGDEAVQQQLDLADPRVIKARTLPRLACVLVR